MNRFSLRYFSLLSVLLACTVLFWTGCDSTGSESNTVSGSVLNVTSRPVDGAQVTLQSASGSQTTANASTPPSSSADATYQTTANPDGEYTIENVEEGTYTVTISGPGYNDETFDLDVSSDMTLDPETLVGPGNVQGTVVNAQTGLPLDSATVSFDADADTSLDAADLVVDTDLDGTFTINGAPTGTFVGVVRADNFFTQTLPNVEITVGDTTDVGTLAPSPGLGEEKMRIVLSWGQNPSDLDSHLTGPTGGGGRFHVYYANQSPSGADANLDLDDVSSFGPETITIESYEDGLYRYSVHNYSNQSSDGAVGIDDSPARIEVYDQGGQIATYTPPDASPGDGNTWRVFELTVSGSNVSIDDNGGNTFGYVQAAGSGDEGTFRGDRKPPMTREQVGAF